MATFKGNNECVIGRSKNCFVPSLVLLWMVCGQQMVAASCFVKNDFAVQCCATVQPSDISTLNISKSKKIKFVYAHNKVYTRGHFPPSIWEFSIHQTSAFTITADAFRKLNTPTLMVVHLIGLDYDMQTPFPALRNLGKIIFNLKIQRYTFGKRGRISLSKAFLDRDMMKKLERFELPNNRISSISEEFLKDATRLEFIDLSNNLITKIPACFKAVVPMHIKLAHNRIRTMTGNDFRHEGCPLEGLDLSFNSLQTLPPQALNKQCRLKKIKLSENFQLKCLDDLAFASNSKTFGIDVSYTLIDELNFVQAIIDKTTETELSIRDTRLVCDCQMERFVQNAKSMVLGTCLWNGTAMDIHSIELMDKWDLEGCASVQSPRQCRGVLIIQGNATDDQPEKPKKVTEVLNLKIVQVTIITSTIIVIIALIFGVAIFLDIGEFLIAKEQYDESDDSESQASVTGNPP